MGRARELEPEPSEHETAGILVLVVMNKTRDSPWRFRVHGDNLVSIFKPLRAMEFECVAYRQPG
jgi:hypothetical protein